MALCAAGRRTSTPRHVVPEQQAQASGHYEQISSGGYEQEYESKCQFILILKTLNTYFIKLVTLLPLNSIAITTWNVVLKYNLTLILGDWLK